MNERVACNQGPQDDSPHFPWVRIWAQLGETGIHRSSSCVQCESLHVLESYQDLKLSVSVFKGSIFL